VVTTDLDAVEKYHSIGYSNVILSQWACNHFLYQSRELTPVYDVSFVGEAHGRRKAIIKAINNAGIPVLTRGNGWASGRVSHEQMIRIFNQSRINLNLANASVQHVPRWVELIDRYALYTPRIKGIWRRIRSGSWTQAHMGNVQPISQIKGRNFEVPGCGGFLITEYVKGLERYYQPDRDIVCYSTLNELINKVQFYLAHDDLRREIASSGWKTTLEQHTYVHRFNQVFEKLGLAHNFSVIRKPGWCRETVADL
jgi:spore maturation protein CgeB